MLAEKCEIGLGEKKSHEEGFLEAGLADAGWKLKKVHLKVASI